MKNIKKEIKESINKGDIFFENKYFNEAIFEYKKALSLSKELDKNFIEKTKEHILYVLEKKAYCYNELNQKVEAVETYLKIIKFLNKYFNKTEKINFSNKNYEEISSSINELYIEADIAQKDLNYNQALLIRKKAIMLAEIISIYIGDLLFYKFPYEILKQADLYKIIGDFRQAEHYYNELINLADKYSGTDSEFFENFIYEAFDRVITFYEDTENFQKMKDNISLFIDFLEKNYKNGKNINFIKLADLYVQKGLYTKNDSEKYKLFHKANEFYNSIESDKIEDKFFFFICYIETNMFITIDETENYQSSEELCETFQKNSIKNFGTLYYLKSLKLLLQSYFSQRKIFRIFKIDKNLHINRNLLKDEEKELYDEIQTFLTACRMVLNFQKNIYIHATEKIDLNAVKSYDNFCKLYKISFINNYDFTYYIYNLFKIYKYNIKNNDKAFYYLNKVKILYKDAVDNTISNKLFAESFYELAELYAEKKDLKNAEAVISKAIDLYKVLYKDNKEEFAIFLHDCLIKKSKINYALYKNYNSSLIFIEEAIDTLKKNIKNSMELIKIIKSLSLKAEKEYEEDNKKDVLENYLKICQIYENYNFANKGNLDRIYANTIEEGIIKSQELKNKKVEAVLIEKKKNIKLIQIS